ncbi:hypothetical protein ACHWQZ_G009721 [Mnemiopsis leidyi]
MASSNNTYIVLLLDGRQYSCKLNSKTLTEELFDCVISYLGIQEREYFGLCYISEPGKYREWIALEKRLGEHELPRSNGNIVIHFAVKFYIDNICWLHDPTTVEQFYLQAREAVYNERLQCEKDLAYKLAALALQEIRGDFTTEEAAMKTLTKYNLLSPGAPSSSYLEVLHHYKILQGWSRGKSIINYLNKATELKGYGVHLYQVKDKNGVPWWIGMSPRGIAQYALQDTYNPIQLFKWNELDNVYFRDKKFSIEINQGSKSQSAVQHKQYSSVLMHAWYSPNNKLVKSMWQMAVHQHQFYLEKKVNNSSKIKYNNARSLNDIVAELSTSVMSLDSIGYPERSTFSDSKSEDSVNFGFGAGRPGSAAADELWEALLEQRKVLLERKSQLQTTLSVLDCEEADIRGSVECENSSAPTVATSYPIASDPLPFDVVSRLELEYEIQCKIISAAVRLSKEKGIEKSIKKERLQAAQRAQLKMLDIERRLDAARKFKMGGARQRSNSGHKSLPERTERDGSECSRHEEQMPQSYCSQGSLSRHHRSDSDYMLERQHNSPLSPLMRSPTPDQRRMVYSPTLDRVISPPQDPATEFARQMMTKLSAKGQSTLV